MVLVLTLLEVHQLNARAAAQRSSGKCVGCLSQGSECRKGLSLGFGCLRLEDGHGLVVIIGGVFVRPVWRHVGPENTDLWMLCDLVPHSVIREVFTR